MNFLHRATFESATILCSSAADGSAESEGRQEKGTPSVAVGEEFVAHVEGSSYLSGHAEWPTAILNGLQDKNVSALLHGAPCVLTGDIGHMDDRGVLHFSGRTDLRVQGIEALP